MRQVIRKICLSSSVFFMASCGMFGGDEETNVEEASPVIIEESQASDDAQEKAETQEVVNSEPVVLDDEIEMSQIQRLPEKNDGPHIIKRDGKFWIIAEPSAQLSSVLRALGDNVQGVSHEPSPGYLRLARELNYRINEMAFNTGATTEDYKELFEKSLQTIEAIAVAEAEAKKACYSCSDNCDQDKEMECAASEVEGEPNTEKLEDIAKDK